MDRSAPIVWHVKPCLLQAIRLLETWSCGRDPGHDEQLLKWSHWPVDRARRVASEFLRISNTPGPHGLPLLIEATVGRRTPTALYVRRHSPTAYVLALLCAEASVPWQRAGTGRLARADFAGLIRASGRIAGSPLSICDARPHRPLVGTRIDFASWRSTALGTPAIPGWSGRPGGRSKPRL